MRHPLRILTLTLLLVSAAAQAQSTAPIALYDGPDRQAKLVEGANREGSLTLYATTPIEYLRVIITGFESKYGVKVNLWRTRSENVLQRIVSESRGNKPAFDVVECITPPMEALRKEGLLQRVNAPVHGELQAWALPAHREWAFRFLEGVDELFVLFGGLVELIAGLVQPADNHDTDTVENWRNLFQSQLADRNLHGRVVQIDGVRVAGLGGVFRGEVWYPDPADAPFNYESYEDYKKRAEPGRIVTARQAREARKFTDVSCLGKSPHGTPAGKLLTHRSTIFYKDWFELYGQGADILVTHEAPGCHPHGFRVLTELARSMKVKFSFHGHHHDCLNYSASFAEMGHRAYGVGLRGVTDMYGGQIRVGAYEEQRVSRVVKD